MNVKQISDAHKVSVSMVYHLIDNSKKTTNLGLAMSVAQITGKKPIEHVTKKYRDLALAAHPELNVVHNRKVSKKA